jgi:S1/P1 Nuclease
MRIAFALLGFLAACISTEAFGWGQEGHSIIAEIAQRRLAPHAATAVGALLGQGRSFASISTWADDIRSARPTTSQWHFADVPIDRGDYSPARDCQPDPAKGDCIVAELERLRTELLCGTDEQKTEALMFALHFVGDIHQPLHTVKESGGGNAIDVQFTVNGLICTSDCPPPILTNFHRAWDSDLIHKTVFSWGSYVDRLETGWLKSAEARQIGLSGGKPADWVVETHKAARRVWQLLPPGTVTIDGKEYRVMDDAYFNQVLPVLDRQLGVGGLRLARFLNETYQSPKCPTASSNAR